MHAPLGRERFGRESLGRESLGRESLGPASLVRNPRDRRALVLGGIVVAVAVLATRVLPQTVQLMRAEWTSLEGKQRLAAQLRAEVGALPVLQDAGPRIRTELLALAPRILAGASAAQAVADLSGRVQVMADQHRLALNAADQIPDTLATGVLRRVTVRAALEGDSQGVLAFLRALETDSVVLRLVEPRITALDPGSAPTVPERLRLDVTIQGWYLATAAADTSAADVANVRAGPDGALATASSELPGS